MCNSIGFLYEAALRQPRIFYKIGLPKFNQSNTFKIGDKAG